MTLAINNKDLVELVRLLEFDPGKWSSGSKFFHESQRNEVVTLLHKLTTEGFGVGLQSYLNRCWHQVPREDARDASGWCITNGAATIGTRVLLEAAAESKPAFISSRAIFFFASFSTYMTSLIGWPECPRSE